MSEYYAVQRSGDELAHYGVKGMKWGVRKAIQSGNSRALGRQYRKAAKKLAKLEKRATSGKKYAKRAAAYGAGAAVAGGLAAVGTTGVAKGMNAVGNATFKGARAVGNAMMKTKSNKLKRAGTALVSGAGKATLGIGKGASAVEKWGNTKTGVGINMGGNSSTKMLYEGSKGKLARIGAAAVGAGLGVAAARNAYKAATTKKAAKKAAQFKSEMNKAFAGTKYANGGSANKSSGTSKKRRKSARA